MAYPKYADTGKYNWLLGNVFMTKRANLQRQPPKQCATCICCSSSQVDKKTAKAMVLCCMDFRLRDNMICQLNIRGYKNNYDEVIDAGSSLGYNGLLDYENWNIFIDQQITLAYNLHNISEIIVIDHLDCGAYKAQYGSEYDTNALQLHTDNITKCINTLWSVYGIGGSGSTLIPNLVINGYLLSIDGCNLDLIYSRSA